MRYLCAYIKSHWNDVFLWTLQKYWNITQSFSMEILHKWTVSTNLSEIHTKICGNYLTKEIIPHQEIRRNSSSFHSASYFCLYFMSFIKWGLNFSIRYISYHVLMSHISYMTLDIIYCLNSIRYIHIYIYYIYIYILYIYVDIWIIRVIYHIREVFCRRNPHKNQTKSKMDSKICQNLKILIRRGIHGYNS